MTEQFTPGPWRWEHFPDNESYLLDSDNFSILEGSIVSRGQAVWEANARLIAAAPDLLAELEEIISGWTTIERNQVRGRKLTVWEQERLDMARRVVAKARGE